MVRGRWRRDLRDTCCGSVVAPDWVDIALDSGWPGYPLIVGLAYTTHEPGSTRSLREGLHTTEDSSIAAGNEPFAN
jgi:hypothetical protein